MFRNRRTSQKPDEEFYAAFKSSFPEVGSGTSSAGPIAAQRSASLSHALIDSHLPTPRHFGDVDDSKDHDNIPKAMADSWRLTPSFMDPSSFAFTTIVNQPPGYYTPTPGGINTLYHSQAGDLHTPAMGIHLGTPLSMPHTDQSLQSHDSGIDMQHFEPHLVNPHHQFHNPFVQQQQQQQPPPPQQQSFAPSHFLQHHDSGYEAMEHSPHKSSPQQQQGKFMGGVVLPQTISGPTETNVPAPLIPGSEKFRYHVTLNAPTAMIRSADEIPITYLNKGQAYTMSVFDTMPLALPASPIKYRTFIRISFEDEQQRTKPGACWQLWKEGRGTNEAHQRGGKLLAVEYVDPNQGGDNETRRPQIELESASFDGFCVTWIPNPSTGSCDCSIAVRFNFLSTDFSHSKGVKGIPVRLCAKTEMVIPSPTESSLAGGAEVCFSKVKLFRDHGAERKLSNDVAHVKKTIEKLKQQISQAESGLATFGKRKRSGSIAKPMGSRPGKIAKHKRTWSVDSDGEGSSRLSTEEDIHVKLATMQDMFTSTRPVSVLYLRGEEQDDPDLFPVQLSGEPDMQPLARLETWDSKPSAVSSPSSSGSPTSSSMSTVTPDKRASAYHEPPTSVLQRKGAELWPEHRHFTSKQSAEHATIVPKRERTGSQGNSILAIGVDATYEPLPSPPIRPVACFYVRSRHATKDYYRAIYLMQRTVKDLVNAISEKFQIDPTRITRVTHINSRGLQIVVDEDVVRELPEGQDMIVEFSSTHDSPPAKNELMHPASTDVIVDNELGIFETTVSDPLEMWLNY